MVQEEYETVNQFYFSHRNDFSDICLPPKVYFHPTVGRLSADVKPQTVGVHYCWAHWRSGSIKELKNKLRRKITALM